MEYYTILTDAGRALEAAALAGEKSFTLSMCALGDGTGSPDPAATQLRHEVWRGPLSSLSRDADNPARLVMEAHVPPKDGGFIIREFGIYTDEGVLFAIGNQPESYKPTPAEGSGIELTIRTICTVSSAVSVTLQIDPSIIMASQKYVDEKVAHIRAELDEVIHLTQATTFYVRQDGSDDNDGLTSETAVRSFSQVQKILRAVDSRGYSVTVDIGPGVWGGFTVPEPISIGKLYLRGAGSDLTTLTRPDGYGISHYVAGCCVYLRGVTLTDCVYSIDARRDAVIFIENDINFGPASSFHMLASYGGQIINSSDPLREWRISGSTQAHAFARYGGLIVLPSSSITLEGTPNFSLGFARANFFGGIDLQNCRFEGKATGQRYYIAANGVINTNGKGEAYFPGDRAGEIYTGGQYM